MKGEDRAEFNARMRIVNTDRRERLKADGRCYQCGAELPTWWARGTRCPKCQNDAHVYNGGRYAERKAKHLCVYCGKPAREKRVDCAACAAKRKAKREEAVE